MKTTRKEVDYSSYERSGVVQSETFVQAARKTLQDIADRVRPLVERDDATGKSVAQILLNSEWTNIRNALGTLFTAAVPVAVWPTAPSSAEDIDEEDALDDLEDLIEALSSERNFRDALGSGGEFSGLGGGQANAEKIYNASGDAIALGSTDNTRYGVDVDVMAETAQDAVSSAGRTVRAFAYSPLKDTPLNSLSVRGTARYTGRTFAADTSSGKIFDGAIELMIQFGIGKVDATITDLESVADNDPWTFNGRDVEQIELEASGISTPSGNDRKTTAAFTAEGDDDVELSLADTRFTSAAQRVRRTFRAMFVGKSGQEVLGLWSVGPVMII